MLKAMAFGTNAIIIGGPISLVWPAGEAGVTNVVKLLQREFQMTMVLTGRTNISIIDR